MTNDTPNPDPVDERMVVRDDDGTIIAEVVGSHYARYKAKDQAAKFRAQGRDAWHVLTKSGFHVWAVTIDVESSASRQHYIDTGRYLWRGEALNAAV